jgi:hypothetical protein
VSALEVLHGEAGVAHDLPEQASTKVAFAVHRDGDPAAIVMDENRVAAALPSAHEALSL